jgi:hypothetical protein
MRKIFLFVAIMLPSAGVFAASERESERIFVHIRPELSSFWRTATNNVVELPVDMPRTAKVAALYVDGVGYKRVYSNLRAGIYSLELPEASSPDTENVYRLKLSFDDGTEYTAELGVIEGMRNSKDGCSTRCRLSDRVWKKSTLRGVMPVPYGTRSISVAGVSTEPDIAVLDGAQGWYAFATGGYGKFSVKATLTDSEMSADIAVSNPGCVMMLR